MRDKGTYYLSYYKPNFDTREIYNKYFYRKEA